MFRHLPLTLIAALAMTFAVSACSQNPLPPNAANRTAPDPAPGACTPPVGTGAGPASCPGS